MPLRLGELLARHPLGHGVPSLHAPLAILTGGPGGGQVKPHVRRHVILRDAVAAVVHDPEVELRAGLPLVGGQPAPRDGFGVALRHAPTLGERVSPSPGARPGSSPGPSRQKIPLHRQFADLRVQLADLALMVPPSATPVREHLAKTSNRLMLPRTHLIRMNLVLRGNSLAVSGRPVAPPAQSSPSTPLKTYVSCSSRIPPSARGIHLNDLSDFLGPPQWNSCTTQRPIDFPMGNPTYFNDPPWGVDEAESTSRRRAVICPDGGVGARRSARSRYDVCGPVSRGVYGCTYLIRERL